MCTEIFKGKKDDKVRMRVRKDNWEASFELADIASSFCAAIQAEFGWDLLGFCK